MDWIGLIHKEILSLAFTLAQIWPKTRPDQPRFLHIRRERQRESGAPRADQNGRNLALKLSPLFSY